MNESIGINGEFRVVEEFACTAICHDMPKTRLYGRGENAGIRMTTTPESLSVPPADSLRQLSTSQLCALAASEGSRLPGETLKLIHDIAIERLSSDETNHDQTAGVLSNIVMEQAIARIVTSAT